MLTAMFTVSCDCAVGNNQRELEVPLAGSPRPSETRLSEATPAGLIAEREARRRQSGITTALSRST
jgi:hypothetical protein